MSTSAITAAGLLIHRQARSRTHILLVAQVDGTASLPKGRLEPGEVPWRAAIREVREETGLIVPPGRLGFEGRMGRVAIWEVEADPRIPAVIPKWRLQEEEVVWAGFLPVSEALSALPAWQRGGVRDLLYDVGLL